MAKILILFFLLPLSIGNLFGQKINWPPQYEPTKSKFYVHNEIDIKATPVKVWAILIAAKKWESYYKGAENVVLVNTAGENLAENTIFTWKTMGLNFESIIKEFAPNERLSWESRKKQIQGYHAWLILPTADGCKLITDESQNGWLTFFEKTFQPNKLRRLHDVWLAEIKKKAESANP
jgi:hypothetical protein